MSIQVRSEDGSVLEERGYFHRLVELSQDLPAGSLLSYVDPYADTTFNALQLPVVIRELQSLLDRHPDDARELAGTIDMANTALNSRSYLVFLGD